jgi:uncharacterized protein
MKGGNKKMPKKKIYISWKKLNIMVDKLVKKIKKSKVTFDGIYGIPRGGLPLAVMLSYRLDLPVLLYPTKESLVVDDISDNGFTLERMKNKKIATIYSTSWTITKPTWFIEMKKSEDEWLVFPWEVDG